MTTESRKLYRGTVEKLPVVVTVDPDITLNDQPVAISFDRTTWIAATWVGAAGSTRTCRALVTIAADAAVGGRPVYVRVTDNPEIPILRAGAIEVI